VVIQVPGTSLKLLGTQTQPRMTAHDVVCLHTMVGYLKSTDAYFRDQGFGGTESHLGLGGKWGSDVEPQLDGKTWQWQDVAFTADANYEGNGRVISYETADNAPQDPDDIAEWTPKQLDEIVRVVKWLCSREAHKYCPTSWKCYKEGIPTSLIPNTLKSSRGIGYHAQGTASSMPAGAERWSSTVGKPCPTSRRIKQLKEIIIPRVRDEEDNMGFTADDKNYLGYIVGAITGANNNSTIDDVQPALRDGLNAAKEGRDTTKKVYTGVEELAADFEAFKVSTDAKLNEIIDLVSPTEDSTDA
jgi:hypothetical protein